MTSLWTRLSSLPGEERQAGPSLVSLWAEWSWGRRAELEALVPPTPLALAQTGDRGPGKRGQHSVWSHTDGTSWDFCPVGAREGLANKPLLGATGPRGSA